MRENQWSVIAVVFFLGMLFFMCMAFSAMKGQILSSQIARAELGMGDIIFPLRSSLYFSFAFFCFLIFNIGWICGLIEGRAKKKE